MGKIQAAIEMLVTYSWALLIISLFVAVIFVVSGSRPAQEYVGSQCDIQPLLPCIQSVFSGSTSSAPITFTMAFDNNLGAGIQFPTNAINITVTGVGSAGESSYLGGCLPSFAANGAEIICSVQVPGNVEPAVGTQVVATFTISYNVCNGNKVSSCGSSVYKSTGTALQNFAGSQVTLNRLTLVTNPAASLIVLNGVTYVTDSNVLLQSGTYNVFGQPQAGYEFQSWSVTGSGSTISSNSPQNAILTLNSNVTLTGTFVIAPTTTTTIPFSTTTTSSTSTSTSTSTSSSTSTSTTTTSTTTTVPAPILDNWAGAGGYPSNLPETTPAFSTTNADDMLVVLVSDDGYSGAPSVSDTAGSTWNLEYSAIAGYCGSYWVYYAIPGRILTNDEVTASQTSSLYGAVFVYAISNVNEFDSNPSLPSTATSSTATVSTTYSTNNAADVVIGVSTSCHLNTAASWTGLTGLGTLGDEYGYAYKITTTAQSGASASVTMGTEVGITVFAVTHS